MNSVAIFTCVFGNYETTLKTVHVTQSANFTFDFYCFTDNANALVVSDETNWNIVPFSPCREWCEQEHAGALELMHNVVLCRANPHRLPFVREHTRCVYIDANVLVRDPDLLPSIFANRPPRRLLQLYKSPTRTCAYVESMFSEKRLKKYCNTDLNAQRVRYTEEGMPTDVGVWWNGFIIFFDIHDPAMREFYTLWSDEMTHYVKDATKPYHAQGQVSLPYVLWKLNWLSSTSDGIPRVEEMVPCEHNVVKRVPHHI